MAKESTRKVVTKNKIKRLHMCDTIAIISSILIIVLSLFFMLIIRRRLIKALFYVVILLSIRECRESIEELQLFRDYK